MLELGWWINVPRRERVDEDTNFSNRKDKEIATNFSQISRCGTEGTKEAN